MKITRTFWVRQYGKEVFLFPNRVAANSGNLSLASVGIGDNTIIKELNLQDCEVKIISMTIREDVSFGKGKPIKSRNYMRV
jgi:hypothetical protein